MLKRPNPNSHFPVYLVTCFLIFPLMAGISVAFNDFSKGQIVCWQIGNAGAICGAVLSSVWFANKDEHMPSAGYVIMAIVHGISFSSLIVNEIEPRIFATCAIVIIPAVFFISFYKGFPLWLHISAYLCCAFFLAMYIRMLMDVYYFNDWSQSGAYGMLHITIFGWCYHIIKNWKKEVRA